MQIICAVVAQQTLVPKFDKFNVKTNKLDNFKFSNKISFIKIDVEGHELKVIDGAKETLKKHKPNLLIEIEEKHSKKQNINQLNSNRKKQKQEIDKSHEEKDELTKKQFKKESDLKKIKKMWVIKATIEIFIVQLFIYNLD